MRKAVVYVASKRRYIDEALVSVQSLRRNGGDVKVYLKTILSEITPAECEVFDEVLPLENPVYSFIDKVSFLEGVQEEFVMFLDGDTFVAGDLTPGFELLRRFDLAVSHAPFRFGGTGGVIPEDDPRVGALPSAYCEFNTGVIFARNTPRLREAFQAWPDYQQDIDLHDQPSFMRMLWDTDLNFYVLPPEWNARVTYPIFLCDEAKIVHARLPDMAKAAEALNHTLGPRIIDNADL